MVAEGNKLYNLGVSDKKVDQPKPRGAQQSAQQLDTFTLLCRYYAASRCVVSVFVDDCWFFIHKYLQNPVIGLSKLLEILVFSQI